MLRRRCLRTAFAGGLAAAILCTTPALAAPPTAGDESITARPRGTTDVLVNDTGSGITVAGNEQPSHGSASCAPLGGCLYKAEAGYTGPDSFTYTLRDSDGATATGTVHVTVEASTASSSLLPTDDDAATLAGRSVDIKVLDNDGGAAPLTVTGQTTPSHGNVTCTDGGTCTYTPADGYTGADGFRYTVDDASSAPPATADVHILVVAADARYALGLGNNPASIGDGGAAHWTGSISAAPSGIALEELAALPLPNVTLGLSGPHGLEGKVKTAKGWSASDDATHASAGPGALLGNAVTEAFPRPLPPINTGTGGDGHVPILVGSKIFAFYHHSSPTSVSCIDRRTGEACPGYPMHLTFNTSNINGPAVVLGTKIYTHLWPSGNYAFSGSGGSGGYAQTSSIGLFCWDAATNDTCGYHVLARRESTNPAGASAPIQVGDRIYMAGDGGRLYCFDPATNDPCGSIPTGLTADPGEYDVVGHGTRVYASRSTSFGTGDSVTCVDVATGAACAGWETPKSFGRHWNVINQHDATGAVIGVCVVGAGAADCLPDADPGSPTHIAAFVPRLDDYYNVTQEAEAGTRTFFGSLNFGGVGCWDWSTGASCAGGGFNAEGWAGPPYRAYGATWDGSCVVALGDSMRAFTVDAQGNSPCTSLSSGTNKRTIDLRDQRFDGTVGKAHWNAVTLHDVAPGELTSVVVTVHDAATGEALATGDLVAGGALDLSGIDADKHPAVTLDATSTEPAGQNAPLPNLDAVRAGRLTGRVGASATASAWDDAIPPRLRLSWTADPQQVGFTTRSTSDCATAAGTVLGAAGHLAGGDAVGAQVALARSASCAKPVAAAAVPKACSGLRFFKIHIRYAGKKIRRLTVTANGKKQKVLTLKGRPIAQVDLKGLPTSTVKVRITIRTKAGKTLKGTRIYHPCTTRLPKRGFKY